MYSAVKNFDGRTISVLCQDNAQLKVANKLIEVNFQSDSNQSAVKKTGSLSLLISS